MFSEYLANLKQALEQTKVDIQGATVTIDQGLAHYMGQIWTAQQRGHRTFFIGNGGSAGICTHSANDYSKNGGLRCMALHDGAVLTCLGNDFGFEYIFSKQIEFHASEGDVLVAISSSGSSKDILNAVNQAKDQGLFVISFSGFYEDNPLRKMGDLNFYVPSQEYGFVELGHQILIHSALDMKEELLKKFSS